MSVRIGRTIIDTREWTTEDYSTVIRALRDERARKVQADELKARMANLLSDAKEQHFDFINRDFGNIVTMDDFELYDNE